MEDICGDQNELLSQVKQGNTIPEDRESKCDGNSQSKINPSKTEPIDDVDGEGISIQENAQLSHHIDVGQTITNYYCNAKVNTKYDCFDQINTDDDYNAEVNTDDDYNAKVNTDDDYNAQISTDDDNNAKVNTDDDYNAQISTDGHWNAQVNNDDDYNAQVIFDDDYNAQVNTDDDYNAQVNTDDDYNAQVIFDDVYNAQGNTDDDYNAQVNTDDDYNAQVIFDDVYNAQGNTDDDYNAQVNTNDGNNLPLVYPVDLNVNDLNAYVLINDTGRWFFLRDERNCAALAVNIDNGDRSSFVLNDDNVLIELDPDEPNNVTETVSEDETSGLAISEYTESLSYEYNAVIAVSGDEREFVVEPVVNITPVMFFLLIYLLTSIEVQNPSSGTYNVNIFLFVIIVYLWC
ncbi:serine-aspartate repeat-containing protein I-like isoform X2 [Argopecten irradians]|uniref:serine-aspartate repeat-containing protein I-like isoform X2 n=1 Tax=Argopecten irradians TaxID=31199 RepID=UPI003719160B